MWVKLTFAHSDEPVYVNLDRFDTVRVTMGEEGDTVTRITTCLSSVEEDYSSIDVKEPPEAFMGPPKMKVPDNGQ